MAELEDFNNKFMESLNQSRYKDRRPVLGSGNGENPVLTLIGEAPGAKEEAEGRPFVGSAGKNLDEFLRILEIERKDIYITNTVKIRPYKLSPKTGKPINRTPDSEELAFFSPFLLKELTLFNTGIIVTLGGTALRAILGKDALIGQLHGQALSFGGNTLFPLYHPAAVIYDRKLKEVYIEDLHGLKSLLKK